MFAYICHRHRMWSELRLHVRIAIGHKVYIEHWHCSTQWSTRAFDESKKKRERRDKMGYHEPVKNRESPEKRYCISTRDWERQQSVRPETDHCLNWLRLSEAAELKVLEVRPHHHSIDLREETTHRVNTAMMQDELSYQKRKVLSRYAHDNGRR